MVSSLIKLNLAKRTAVVHRGSYSQSTHKRASPHSQTGGLHHQPRSVLLQIQFLRIPLHYGTLWVQVTATQEDKTSERQQWLSGPGELITGLAQPFEEPAQESLRVPLSGFQSCFSADTVPHHVPGHSWCWFLTFTTRDKCRPSSLVPNQKFQGRALMGSSRLRS